MNKGIEIILQKIRSNEDVLTMRMGEIRDAFGYKHLSEKKVDQIDSELESARIVCYPRMVPYQYFKVRLYVKGTLIGSLIDHVRNVGEESDGALRRHIYGRGDKAIREIRDMTDSYLKVLDRLL